MYTEPESHDPDPTKTSPRPSLARSSNSSYSSHGRPLAPLTPITSDPNSNAQDQDGASNGRPSWSRQSTFSPSESGTEADDESPSLLSRALPAAPYRPRKGLRRKARTGSKNSHTTSSNSNSNSNSNNSNHNDDDDEDEVSPPLTPTKLDNEILRLSDVGIHEPGPKEPSPDTQEASASASAVPAKSRSVWRRRAEILRRLVEGVLLALSGVLVLFSQRTWWLMAKPVKLALLSHLLILGSMYFIYPFRLVRFARIVGNSTKPFWLCIRISAAFDPAAYIYPTILPVVVALSLYSDMPTALLPNLMLGLAAMPAHVIGFRSNQFTFMLHWMLTLIPLKVAHSIPILHSNLVEIPEALLYLFPLHSNLIPMLHSFTTTSLLPAELQLLSISLVNLLFLSTSPPARTLAILLWVGGLGILVFCSPVIQWGIELARVPQWRLKRAGRIAQARRLFLNALNSVVDRKRQPQADHKIINSDSEDEHLLPQRTSKLATLKDEVINALKQSLCLPYDAEEAKSDGDKEFSQHLQDGTTSRQRRRNTIAGNGPLTHSDSAKRRRRRTLAHSYYRSLTTEQATLRKWGYAIYLYAIILALILGPIRYLVSNLALNGYEPFGWAIGYLAGSIRPLRLWVVTTPMLSSWIPLPSLEPSSSSSSSSPSSITSFTSFTTLLSHFFGILPPSTTRLIISGYSLLVLTTGLAAVHILTYHASSSQLSIATEVDTRRKIFHLTILLILLPTLPLDPHFLGLALALILAIFALADLLRASQLPPLSVPLARFVAPYVDGRDLRGPVVVSHLFLGIGCAVPVWLSLASLPRSANSMHVIEPADLFTPSSDPWAGWQVPSAGDSAGKPLITLDLLAGAVCVGLGDAAASLIGRRWGRRKWVWAGGKSLEGSAAFAAAVVGGLVAGKVLLHLLVDNSGDGGSSDGSSNSTSSTSSTTAVGHLAWDWGKMWLVAGAASLMEAVLTGGNDNVIVPVVLWVFIRAVRL